MIGKWLADQPMLAFILTAALQAAFLGSKTVKRMLGFDLTRPEVRAAYINKLERTVQIDE